MSFRDAQIYFVIFLLLICACITLRKKTSRDAGDDVSGSYVSLLEKIEKFLFYLAAFLIFFIIWG